MMRDMHLVTSTILQCIGVGLLASATLRQACRRDESRIDTGCHGATVTLPAAAAADAAGKVVCICEAGVPWGQEGRLPAAPTRETSSSAPTVAPNRITVCPCSTAVCTRMPSLHVVFMAEGAHCAALITDVLSPLPRPLVLLCGAAAKTHYGTSLANVDWLHGSAESLLTITNLFVGECWGTVGWLC